MKYYKEKCNIRAKFSRLVGSRYIIYTIRKRKQIDKTVKKIGILAFSIPFIFLLSVIVSSLFGSARSLASYKIYIENNIEHKNYNRDEIINLLYHKIKNYIPEFQMEEFSLIFASDSIYDFKNNKNWITISQKLERYYKKPKSIEDKKIITIAEELKKQNKIKRFFNVTALIKGDSISPNHSGILGCIVGSTMTIIICLLFSIPIGISTGLYIAEIMKHSWYRSILEISINNLSATPSVIFGIMAFTIYLKNFGLTRSSSFVGGLTLTFIILPVIIASTKQAAESVPKQIKYGAYALGASPLQTILHHTLPMSLPGIITGILLGIARVLGEAAPLLMIGMSALVTVIPQNFNSPATVIPLQIYTWAFRPEESYRDLTSLLIFITILLLATLNITAQIIQNKMYKNNDS